MNARRGRITLGALCIVVAVIGLFVNLRGFDRTLRAVDVPANEFGAWRSEASTSALAVLQLGRYDVPKPGILRAVVCPSDHKDPHAKLRVTDDRGRVLGEENFTPDESRGGRCFEAAYHTRSAATVSASIAVPQWVVNVCQPPDTKSGRPECPSAKKPVRIPEVEVRASRQITPPSMWPVLALLFGFGLLVFAPRDPPSAVREGEELGSGVDEPPQLAPTPHSLEATPYAGGLIPPGFIRPGVVPAGFGSNEDPAVGDATYRAAWTASAPKRPFSGAPVDWPFSPLLALGGYLVAHVAVFAVAVPLAVRYGEHTLMTGTGIAVTMLVQHAALIVIAAWMLGAFGAREVRVALGFLPVNAAEVVRALLTAGALLAIAVATTHFIKDVSASPMGQAIERMPVRYAIGFGAMLAPLSEELFFRGVLVRAFGKRRMWIGVLVSAVVFTAAHGMQLTGALVGLVPIASVGVANGILRARTGGITQSWIVHCAYNGALSIGLYFT